MNKYTNKKNNLKNFMNKIKINFLNKNTNKQIINIIIIKLFIKKLLININLNILQMNIQVLLILNKNL